MAIGPSDALTSAELPHHTFLKYQMAVVVGPGHALARSRPAPRRAARASCGCSGPRRAEHDGVTRRLLRHFEVPEEGQRIFQSHAAALEEIKRDNGVGVAVTFGVADDLAEGRLVQVDVRGARAEGMWSAMTLPGHSTTVGRRRARPLHHHAARHPGDAAGRRRHDRPLPPQRPRHPLELSATGVRGLEPARPDPSSMPASAACETPIRRRRGAGRARARRGRPHRRRHAGRRRIRRASRCPGARPVPRWSRQRRMGVRRQ